MQQGSSNPKEAHQLTLEDLRNIRSQLDKRSSAHCLAKWFQVTLNLHNGRSASCCLQPSKKIHVEPLSIDASKIYNTPEHIDDRFKLRDGIKIDDCQACWSVEESGGFSERHYKSGDSWAWGNLTRADADPNDVKPTYVEVSFSSQCQLRCSYCNPETSSSIAQEVEKFGAYPDSQTQMSRADRLRKGALPWNEEFPDQPNPYIESFWRWLPSVYDGLRVFRITGGEPFLSEDTFKFIEYVRNNPNSQMDIQFNSNLSFPEKVFERFMSVFKSVPKSHYKKVVLYASLDSWGDRAEYIRHGLRLPVMMDNIDKLLTEFPNLELRFTSTISILACHGLQEMLLQIANLKKKWGKNRVLISIYPLVFPSFQSIRIAKSEVDQPLQEALEYARKENQLFDAREVMMLEALSNLKPFDSAKSNQLTTDFYLFFKEYDRRKKTRFLSTFPEFSKLWSKAQELAQSQRTYLLGQIFSSDSALAVKACSELNRIDQLDLDYQLAMAKRLVEIDPLTLDFLARIETLHLKVTQYLISQMHIPSCAHSILSLLVRRKYQTEQLFTAFKDIISKRSDQEVYDACPSWFDFLRQELSSDTAHNIFLQLFKFSLDQSRSRVAERLLLYLDGSDAQNLPDQWCFRLKILTNPQQSTAELLNFLADDELDYLPGLVLSKIDDPALLKNILLSCLKANIVTDVVVAAFSRNKTLFNRDLFTQLKPETCFSYARVAVALNRSDDLLAFAKTLFSTFTPEQIASCLAQFKQAGISSKAAYSLSLISAYNTNSLPWTWLDQVIELCGVNSLIQELDSKFGSAEDISWQQELLDYIFKKFPDSEVVTTSAVAALLKANHGQLDHESWWHALCGCDLNDTGWAIYRLSPDSIDLSKYHHPEAASTLANRFSVIYQLRSSTKFSNWNTLFKLLKDEDRWFVLDNLQDKKSIALLACWTRDLNLARDFEGKLFEYLKETRFPEFVDSTVWTGLGLSTWASWVNPKDFLLGISKLSFDDQAYAISFQNIVVWKSESFHELISLNPLLIKECIFVHGITDELSKFFTEHTSFSGLELLIDLDCHLIWRDELLCKLTPLYPAEIRRELLVWSFNKRLPLFSNCIKKVEISDQDLWAILSSCPRPATEQLLQLLQLFQEISSLEIQASIIARGIEHTHAPAIVELPLPWFNNDLLLQLYCKHSRLDDLIKALSSKDETIIYRALDLWHSYQNDITEAHIKLWHDLGLSFCSKLYQLSKNSCVWNKYLLNIAPDRSLEFMRDQKDISLLHAVLECQWPKLLDSTSSRVHEFGDWLKSTLKAEAILAVTCDHFVYGDYCLNLWFKTDKKYSDIVFNKLVKRFCSSPDYDYLKDQISKVYCLSSKTKLDLSVNLISKDRIAATMRLFVVDLNAPSLATSFLQDIWTVFDFRLEALYAADREGILKNKKLLPWLMIRLSESLTQDDDIAWNIVDLIISNDLEKVAVIKLYQTLIHKEQQDKKPALKLISFAKELGSFSSF
tara:strand:- start:509 stop:4978 length:4470 start_codon:yes stop_codon:yes gene_type:complete